MSTQVSKLAALLAVLMLYAAPLGAQEDEAQNGPPPALVHVDEARAQRVTIMRPVSGDLRAVRRSRVAAEEEGLVLELLVERGQFVQRGQVIARLDATVVEIEALRWQAMVEMSGAVVDERRAAHRQARRDIERLQDAFEEASIADSELEDAQIALDSAAARLRAAQAELASNEAQLDRARETVEDMTIRALFDGQVVEKLTEVGSWVERGGDVVELVSLETIDAYVDVPERLIPPLLGGDVTVGIDIPAVGDQIDSDDVMIIASGDELARTFPVRVRLKNPDGLLKPGMSVRALLPTGAIEQAVTIHKDAVQRDTGGAYAYMNANNTAIAMRFDVRWYVGDRVVVDNPRIQPGMQFVVEGNERLYPTAPLTVINAQTAQQPGSESPASGG